MGIDLKYGTPGEVIVSMDRYITKAIDKYLEERMKSIKMPAGNHLLKVNEACRKLCDRYKIIFHRLVEKLLFLSKRARSDIQPKIAFLATIVRNPNKDNWKNLRRVLSYLDAKINSVKLHLNANYMNAVHWWVDTS